MLALKRLFTKCYFRDKFLSMLYIVLYLIVGIVSVVGNTLVIYIIWKSKELRHSQYVYKCSIAVADIIWGFSISYTFLEYGVYLFSEDIRLSKVLKFGLKVSHENKSNTTVYDYDVDSMRVISNSYDETSVFFNIMVVFKLIGMPITIFVSIVSLVFLAADRFFALTFPLRYKKAKTRRSAKIVSVLIWVTVTFVYTTLNYVSFFVLNNFENAPILQPCLNCTFESAIQKFHAIVLFIPFFLLLFFTTLTLLSLKRSYKRSKKLNRRVQKAQLSAEKQMSYVLVVMVCAFSFSLLPTLGSYVYFYFLKMKNNDISDYYNPALPHICIAFLATNSFWNIVIYNVFNKKFRAASVKVFKDTFKCFC